MTALFFKGDGTVHDFSTGETKAVSSIIGEEEEQKEATENRGPLHFMKYMF